ncbi:MAG: hypothetical protein NTU85_01350 [Candidatus Kaiserbacteria bacterium]|nr:hypothetical protein [Candidatus Kaiserbacteria bacterium]
MRLLNNLDRKIYRIIVGKPVVPPPYEVKRATIEAYAKKFSTDIFIETGTYMGETIDALKNTFKKLISIELGKELFEKATNKFKMYSHITILNGDSAHVLHSVLAPINETILFWLDGHYSGGITAKGDLNTPIVKELQLILNHKIKNHVILIDDARCFIGENDYPTIGELFSFILKITDDFSFAVENDIIRITPRVGNAHVRSKDYSEPLRQMFGHEYRHLRLFVKRVIGYGKN